MKILVSGAGGFIGSHLIPYLQNQGHEIVRLVRSAPKEGQFQWSPSEEQIDKAAFAGVEAVINLCGESIMGLWTTTKKNNIRNSREMSTRLICRMLCELESPPKIWINASAIGYYGHRGDEVLTEESSSGSDFLSDVCTKWEEATHKATEKGIRVIQYRIGVVLGNGGALKSMLLPFRLGMGGVLGSGKQYMSWIDIEDLLAAIGHMLVTKEISGPVNGVAPYPVTNREFTKTLGKVLFRPTLFPVPTFVLRLLLSEMADNTLLCSACIHPNRLTQNGFQFSYPQLEASLRRILKK